MFRSQEQFITRSSLFRRLSKYDSLEGMRLWEQLCRFGTTEYFAGPNEKDEGFHTQGEDENCGGD
jgi:hypothetical protein